MIRNSRTQTFNDGIVHIYNVSDSAEDGNMPAEKLKPKETLRFNRRTIGLTRYYTALQANQQVDAVIRCPYRRTVSAQDIAQIEKKQYRVTLVQVPEDIVPPVMDLTLERLEQDYELAES